MSAQPSTVAGVTSVPLADDADARWLEGQRVIHEPAALRAWLRNLRAGMPTVRVALVPTMGALHRGHLALCDRARAEADVVIVSVFVNPAQFAPHEDLASYPRTLASDCAALASRGVDLVFAPSAAAMYPAGFQTHVGVAELAEDFCGASRPHFFGGVAVVVLKLLNLALPDVAVFGEKDWQQLQVVRRMVRDLDHPTAIVGAPLVRDSDGLALSSRNAYLDAATRAQALSLPRALADLAARAQAGERDAAALVAAARAAIEAAGGRVDYLAIADPDTLRRLDRLPKREGADGERGPARALAAVWFGGTRLLDNVAVP